ncbi:MAG: alpha/beta fold hydrolase [Sandaracinaceae bacterium]|nr:alpha/beta fold hydrolase [Sandaracinaceae bacterium]
MPDRDPREPRPEHAVVRASDGYPLAVRVHSPRGGAARATLLVHSATAAPQAYYGRFAAFAASRGLRVVTYDYRGIGGSRPASLRGLDASMTDWARLDAAAVHAWVRRRFRAPLVSIGHSFGGQLLGLAAEASDVEGAVLVAAQLGYMGHWPARERAKLAFFWYGMIPAMTSAVGYLPRLGRPRRGAPEGRGARVGEVVPLAGLPPRSRPRGARSPRRVRSPRPRLQLRGRRLRAAARGGRADGGAEARPLEHRHLAPSALGAERIGHFGFFRPSFEATLWPEVVRFASEIGERAARSAA